MPEIDARREELLKQRDELRQRHDKIMADLNHGLEADLEEQAIQLENRDTLLEIERVTSEQLVRIEEELGKLGDDPEYASSR